MVLKKGGKKKSHMGNWSWRPDADTRKALGRWERREALKRAAAKELRAVQRMDNGKEDFDGLDDNA